MGMWISPPYRLTLGKPFTLGDVSPEQVILCAAPASRAEDQDPIDLAVLSGVVYSGLQLLSGGGRDDRALGAAQRRRHPFHCL